MFRYIFIAHKVPKESMPNFISGQLFSIFHIQNTDDYWGSTEKEESVFYSTLPGNQVVSECLSRSRGAVWLKVYNLTDLQDT